MATGDHSASETLADDYGLSRVSAARVTEAPALDYRPRDPRASRPGIGLVGCGGISAQHLNAYRAAGYRVVALCDRHERRAHKRREEFYPEAAVYTDYRELLARPDVEVVDLATHPAERLRIIYDAIEAGKHILSQKPFVLDLTDGRRLVERAAARGVRLAVNQNARWAPHFSYLRQALAAGLIGELASARFSLHWDHSWIAGTRFEEIRHLVLFDFAVHWFDLVLYFFQPRRPLRVSASTARARGQRVRPPMLAQVIIEFEEGQASLVFNGAVEYGQEDRTVLAGARGTLVSQGPSLSAQRVTLSTAEGEATPALEGTWFREGFHGAMGELLSAIEEGREPSNNARDNLPSLALCFAAIASADSGQFKTPGEVERVPAGVTSAIRI